MVPELIPYILKRKGLKYTYNYVYVALLYNTRNPILIKLLQWFAPYPVYIEIENTTRCNLKCIMCEHTYWKEKGRDMSFDQFKYIVDQFPGLKWIGLTGIGESFLNKDFLKILEYVKSKSIIVELYDTFVFINKHMAKKLVELEIDQIYVSIDAATKETYEKIRVGAKFESVVENIRNFFKLREEKKLRIPHVDFHYIVFKENIHEMCKFIDLVKSFSPDSRIQFTRLLHNFKEVDHLFVEVPQDIINEVQRKAQETGITIWWNLNVPTKKPPINKCTTWSMPFVFVTGEVIPCCSTNEANRRELQKKNSLGNVFEESFDKIWHSEKYRNLREMLRKGKVPEPCKRCCLYQMK